MAGHSQFKNIMHRKGAQDKKRAKIFTRLIKEIIVATKSGLPDMASNPRLRAAVLAARAENMPKDKIENAIKRGSGETSGDNYEAIRYEGYGVGGVAVIVEVLTDNRNRAASEVRSTFTKHGGNLGETGSVNFMFDHVGQIVFAKGSISEDAMFEAAIEAGAENVEAVDDDFVITTTLEDMHEVVSALEAKFGDPKSSKFTWLPKVTAPVDEEQAASVLKMIDILEDCDDVQEVFSNFEVSEEVMRKLSA
jgi:YebC/PmpR family DNA-binding regulatory protein